jgi:hypothetical protein
MLKTGIKLIFLVFFEELLQVAMSLKVPKGSRQGAEKEVCFVHRILGFHFFPFFILFFLMVLLDVTFNVTVMI